MIVNEPVWAFARAVIENEFLDRASPDVKQEMIKRLAEAIQRNITDSVLLGWASLECWDQPEEESK